jgi:hypothetical protein
MIQVSPHTPAAGATLARDPAVEGGPDTAAATGAHTSGLPHDGAAAGAAAAAGASAGVTLPPPAAEHPLARFGATQGVHRELEQYARLPAPGDTARGPALYSSGQPGSAVAGGFVRAPSAAPQVTRAVPEERLRQIGDVLAKGGTIGRIQDRLLLSTDRLLDTLKKMGIGLEQRAGVSTHYDPVTRTMVLGAGESAAEQARALVFEMRKLQIDNNKHAIERDLGNRDFANENHRTGGRADESLRERYHPKTREAFVRDRMDTVVQAAGDALEFARDSRARGAAPAKAPLEDVYTRAYDQAYRDEYLKVYARTLSHNVADNAARDAGSLAGRGAVAQAVHAGQLLTPDTRERYAAVFNRQWDAKEAQAAKQAAEADKARAANAAESERRAKIETGRKALVELIKGVDPKSADAHKVIQLLHAYASVYGGEVLTLGDAREAIGRLLGPFGYRDDVGSMKLEVARLHYALENYARLTPQQRAEVMNHPQRAARHGIQQTITYQELQARESQQLHFMRPDGTTFRGTRAELREAEQRQLINHALAQLNQIRNAGPASLVGRIVAGEKGAAIGALFDGMLPVTAGAKSRTNARSGVGSQPVDNRTPVQQDVRRAPAPAKPPASEVQPDRPGAPRGAGGPAGGAAQNGGAARNDGPAQNGGAQNGGGAQNANGRAAQGGETVVDTAPSDPGRAQRRQEQQEAREAARARRAEKIARRTEDMNRKLEAINNSRDPIAATMPGPKESITAERALQGMEQQRWPTVASMNPRRHAEAWREAGNTGTPPVAFRDGNTIRIDLQRLTAEQQQRFRAQAMPVAPAAQEPASKPVAGRHNVDPRGRTQPEPSPSQVNGPTAPQLTPSQLDRTTHP